jgi:hypothetical protein
MAIHQVHIFFLNPKEPKEPFVGGAEMIILLWRKKKAREGEKLSQKG